MKTTKEQARNIPVLDEADVVVCEGCYCYRTYFVGKDGDYTVW